MIGVGEWRWENEHLCELKPNHVDWKQQRFKPCDGKKEHRLGILLSVISIKIKSGLREDWAFAKI